MGQKVVREVAVVVINANSRRLAVLLAATTAAAVVLPLTAAVLPDDRADALYHVYDGGGVEITGPSILVLKKLGQSFAVSGNYYVDSVTSASIDVETTASEYTEERTETSLGLQYMYDRSIMSFGYTKSDENDYEANSAHFNISQSMFGDLTTVTMGYSLGWDTVMNNTDASFSEDVDRQHYRLAVSQILTKNMIVDLGFEAITDEGFLNNPYRSVRYRDSSVPRGYSYEAELYPRTRTSNAVALRGKYFLPYRAALSGEYRFFDDTWGISAHTAELGYVHPWRDRWLLKFKYRFYTQDKAEFYSDLFERSAETNFRARDKELSTFNSHTLGFGASYEFVRGWRMVDRGTVNFSYDHIMFSYDDFRDLTAGGDVGQEPAYDFAADVFQFYLSIWY